MVQSSLSILEKLNNPQLRTAKDNFELCTKKDLSNLDLRMGDWSGLRFVCCRLTNSQFPVLLTETVFEDCILDEANLYGCRLYGTEFVRCRMNGLKAIHSRWYGRPSLSHCRAASMDWSESLINGLELYDTDISNFYAKHSFFYRFDTWNSFKNTVTGMRLPNSTAYESGRLDIFSSFCPSNGDGDCLLLDAWRYQDTLRVRSIADIQKGITRSEAMANWILDFIAEHEEIPNRHQFLPLFQP